MNACKFVAAFKLRSDTPEEVIQTLKYMTSREKRMRRSLNHQTTHCSKPPSGKSCCGGMTAPFAGFPHSEMQIHEGGEDKFIDVIIRTYISLGVCIK